MLTVFLIGLCSAGVGTVVFFLMDGPRRQRLRELARLKRYESELDAAEENLVEGRRQLASEQARHRAASAAADAEHAAARERLRAANAAHEQQRDKLAADHAEFDARFACYADLQSENRLLKTHLRHAAVESAKQAYENEQLAGRGDDAARLADDLGRRHLQETRDWIAKALTAGNYAVSKDRLRKSIDRAAAIGFTLQPADEARLFASLQEDYARVARAAQAREEQARVQARMREESIREREVQRAIDAAERERRAVEAALAKAVAEAEGQVAEAQGRHAAEVERLQLLLTEAEAKSLRAVSEAQKTKKGNVYVISNVGSFGEGVFKVGMTRRLNPLDRVAELSSAPVPFPFDIHLMIPSDDAPALEHALHRALHRQRVNRANPRKEFFRVPLREIRGAVEAQGVDLSLVQFVEVPEAAEYRASAAMSDADQDDLESLVGDGDDEDAPIGEE